MIVRDTRDWNLIKIETDAGMYGIGEAYWGPGVKDLVLKRLLIGEDTRSTSADSTRRC